MLELSGAWWVLGIILNFLTCSVSGYQSGIERSWSSNGHYKRASLCTELGAVFWLTLYVAAGTPRTESPVLENEKRALEPSQKHDSHTTTDFLCRLPFPSHQLDSWIGNKAFMGKSRCPPLPVTRPPLQLSPDREQFRHQIELSKQ